MKILIVEDDFISRKVMLHFLYPLGECDVAANGSEAMEAFMEAAKAGQPYDLVTLDIMMPEMSGQETLMRIRMYEEEQGFEAAKIIMTTSLKDRSTVLDSFYNQCDGYLVKPIHSKDLLKMLGELNLLD
jgi:two-component system chemotaxis response regulator CheY